MRGITMLAQKYPLPRTEIESSVCYRYNYTAAEQRAFDVGGHVVGSFECMAVVRCVFGYHLIEMRFHIRPYIGISVFVYGQTRAGMFYEYMRDAGCDVF